MSDTLVSLLLPIGRLLLDGGFGITDLLRAGKEALVIAAVDNVMRSSERVSASRISVMTGLTRKEVASILSQIKGVEANRHVELKLQRALRVLHGWRVDPRFCNKSGRPLALSLRGDGQSFASLVKIYGGDVTPNSVLRELERMNAIVSDGDQRVRFRSLRWRAKSTAKMAELSRLFPDFAKTVASQQLGSERPPFFGFRESFVGSPSQVAKFQRTFSQRATSLLQSVEQWSASQKNTPKLKPDKQSERFRVGIGVYLIKSDVTSTRKLKAGD